MSTTATFCDCRGPRGDVGLQGPQGCQGPSGFIGASGPSGSTGLQGIQGLQGGNGARGCNGARGDFGAVGIQGGVGPTGPSGPTGTAGDRGIQGLVGETGWLGPQGVQGLPGRRGPDGIGLAGPSGTPGLTGPMGHRGAAGPLGVRGSQGYIGAVTSGSTGFTGPSGPAGLPGTNVLFPGLQGIQGIQGPQGLQGQSGLVGAAGVIGAAGPAGPMGYDGAATPGPSGWQGDRGESTSPQDAATLAALQVRLDAARLRLQACCPIPGAEGVQFMAQMSSGQVAISYQGMEWTLLQQPLPSASARLVASSGTAWVAVDDAVQSRLYVSQDDGASWQTHQLSHEVSGCMYDPQLLRFRACHAQDNSATSDSWDNGQTWQQVDDSQVRGGVELYRAQTATRIAYLPQSLLPPLSVYRRNQNEVIGDSALQDAELMPVPSTTLLLSAAQQHFHMMDVVTGDIWSSAVGLGDAQANSWLRIHNAAATNFQFSTDSGLGYAHLIRNQSIQHKTLPADTAFGISQQLDRLMLAGAIRLPAEVGLPNQLTSSSMAWKSLGMATWVIGAQDAAVDERKLWFSVDNGDNWHHAPLAVSGGNVSLTGIVATHIVSAQSVF